MSRRISIPGHPAAAWADWYSKRLDRINAGSKEDYTGYEMDLFEAIRAAQVRGMKRQPKVSHKSRKPTKAERRDETAVIWDACYTRAEAGGGCCECGCGKPLGPGPTAPTGPAQGGWKPELDHFFGRGKVKQAVETCWILRADCHREKTNNRPDAASWLRRFIEHCRRHGYNAARAEAVKREMFVETRSKLGAGLKSRGGGAQ